MRKAYTLVLTLLIFCAITSRVMAQAEKGLIDVSAGVGMISAHQIDVALGGDNEPIYIYRPSPIFSANGKYFFGGRVALGLSVAAQTLKGGSNADWAIGAGANRFSYTMTILNFSPELTLIYAQHRYFRFYTLLAFSYAHSFIRYDYDHSGQRGHYIIAPDNVSFQYTPLGFRFGGKFAFYLELGIGYKGLANGGFSYLIKPETKKHGSH